MHPRKNTRIGGLVAQTTRKLFVVNSLLATVRPSYPAEAVYVLRPRWGEPSCHFCNLFLCSAYGFTSIEHWFDWPIRWTRCRWSFGVLSVRLITDKIKTSEKGFTLTCLIATSPGYLVPELLWSRGFRLKQISHILLTPRRTKVIFTVIHLVQCDGFNECEPRLVCWRWLRGVYNVSSSLRLCWQILFSLFFNITVLFPIWLPTGIKVLLQTCREVLVALLSTDKRSHDVSKYKMGLKSPCFMTYCMYTMLWQ